MSLQTVLTALADAIRSKSGHSGAMTLQQMIEVVSGIQQGGGNSDNNCEAYHITSTSGTVSPKGSGTVKVWGYGLKSSGTYSNTMYAFVGDGYFSGSYGKPSKTGATFGINADGTVSGLPSGLTDLDVLVTIGI